MRKASQCNKLWILELRRRRSDYRASAFSLAELVVSLGILVVLFALAGQVFNFTIQSTGQATAIVEVNQQLRALEQTLRDDLANVQQGQSMILIQGNPVNAYWTRESKEADDDGDPASGYPMISDAEREYVKSGKPVPAPPRADILMFFTARKANSYTDSAVTANVQQVVYGHAELGEYEAQPAGGGGGTTYDFKPIVGGQDGLTPLFPVDQNNYPSPTKICELPASEWHLARRNVLIAPNYSPRVNPPGEDIINTPVARLDDPALLEGATDIISRFLPFGESQSVPFDYERDVLLPENTPDPWQLPRIFNRMTPFARSKLDVTPPPAYAGRLGHYLLPNCASFKVEWTLDPQSSFVAGRLDGMTEVLWFDPGFVENAFNPDPAKDDPLQSLADAAQKAAKRAQDTDAPADKQRALNLESVLNDATASTDAGRLYSLTNRFRATAWPGNDDGFDPIGSDGRANTVAFVANRMRQTSATTGEFVPDDLFPSALRITVDVFDRERRLDRPVRHVMVIPVGR